MRTLTFEGKPVIDKRPAMLAETYAANPDWRPMRGDELTADEWYERGLAEARRLGGMSVQETAEVVPVEAKAVGKAAVAESNVTIDQPVVRELGNYAMNGTEGQSPDPAELSASSYEAGESDDMTSFEADFEPTEADELVAAR